MDCIKVFGRTEAKVDRQQHQTCAVGGRDCEGPERKLRRPDPGERSRVSPVDEAEDAEGDYGGARTDPDFPLPVQQCGHQRKRQKNDEHGQKVPSRQRRQRPNDVPLPTAHQAGGYGQWPSHSWIDAVIEAAGDHGQPKTSRGPLNVVHLQTDG